MLLCIFSMFMNFILKNGENERAENKRDGNSIRNMHVEMVFIMHSFYFLFLFVSGAVVMDIDSLCHHFM